MNLLHTLRLKPLLRVAGPSESIHNAFVGSVPERFLIALVKNNAFVCSANKNSFHFHYDVTSRVVC